MGPGTPWTPTEVVGYLATWPKARPAIHEFAEFAKSVFLEMDTLIFNEYENGLNKFVLNVFNEHTLLGSILSPICLKLNIKGPVESS